MRPIILIAWIILNLSLGNSFLFSMSTEVNSLLDAMSVAMESEVDNLISADHEGTAQSFINDKLRKFKPIALEVYNDFEYSQSPIGTNKTALIQLLQSHWTRLSGSNQVRDLAKRYLQKYACFFGVKQVSLDLPPQENLRINGFNGMNSWMQK